MDDIHLREERTIKSWTNRKNALDECFQYVIFEKSSKEVFIFFIYPTKISHDRLDIVFLRARYIENYKKLFFKG